MLTINLELIHLLIVIVLGLITIAAGFRAAIRALVLPIMRQELAAADAETRQRAEHAHNAIRLEWREALARERGDRERGEDKILRAIERINERLDRLLEGGNV